MRFDAEVIDIRNSATSALIGATIRQGDTLRELNYPIRLDPNNGRLQDHSLPGLADLSIVNFFTKSQGVPLFFRYSPGRRVGRDWRTPKDDGSMPEGDPNDAFDAIVDVFVGDLGFTPFLKWFYERENIENELKVEAVVVIDEVDLHLLPAWQRSIVGDIS
ncbi:MAG TPA: hypothetical protein VIV60_15715 [Polyangiaceae bacterium]